MAKWIRAQRVRNAVIAIGEWAETVKTQGAQHLFPLLALLEKGVDKNDFKPFAEIDDFTFWSKYNRLSTETRSERDSSGKYSTDYYVDPVSRTFRDADHPHRSPATFRKRTFAHAWGAGSFEEREDVVKWKLSADYALIFERKVLKKAGIVTKVPVVDLAIWLFRYDEHTDDSDAHSLEDLFRARFKQDNDDYHRIFEYTQEDESEIFTDVQPKPLEYTSEISNALVPSTKSITKSAPQLKTDDPPIIPEDDFVLLQIRELLAFGSSGFLLEGCPGTGKTWYTKQIAKHLVSEPTKDIYYCQFHPSYGYEDFVEGYRPSEDTKSGFEPIDKLFLDACNRATEIDTPVILIIDEINRGDPARILGEVLTYIERDYRGIEFRLPYSGKPASVPSNLVVIGTMNPHDKSITQLDQALIRRLDHITISPSSERVTEFLERSGNFASDKVDLVVEWFESVQALIPSGIGHTYFKDVVSPEHIRLAWKYRMRPVFAAELELEAGKFENAEKSFKAMYRRLMGQESDED